MSNIHIHLDIVNKKLNTSMPTSTHFLHPQNNYKFIVHNFPSSLIFFITEISRILFFIVVKCSDLHLYIKTSET